MRSVQKARLVTCLVRYPAPNVSSVSLFLPQCVAKRSLAKTERDSRHLHTTTTPHLYKHRISRRRFLLLPAVDELRFER